MTALKVFFILGMGALLFMLIGLGIDAFYEGSGSEYSRNVLFIAYAGSLLFIVFGLVLKPKLIIIKPGLLVGGVITMIYALGQAGAGDVSVPLMFGVSAIGLAVLISLGYKTLIAGGQLADVATEKASKDVRLMRVFYILAVGVLILMFVSTAIHAFYEGSGSGYHRNVLFIAYAGSLLFIVLGLVLKPKLSVVRTGLLVGGVLIMPYALIQSSAGDVSEPVVFGITVFTLAVIIFLGYMKLMERRRPMDSTIKESEDV